MRLFLPLIAALNGAGVEYVVVGGLAVVLHGHVRLTRDIDIVLSMDPSNLSKAMDLLQHEGFVPRAPVAARDFENPQQRRKWIDEKGLVVFSMHNPTNPLVAVDLFADPPIEWHRLHADAQVIEVGGIPVRVCSREHLVEMKRNTGRNQDVADIQALENGP